MKMLAMLGGELSNSAKCFSSFANLSKENCSDLKGTFGTNGGPLGVLESTKKGLQLLSKLTNLSSLCQQNNSLKSNFELRSQISFQRNSFQEFVPLIGKLIEKAHVEPLHVKNNAWQYFLRVF